MTEKAKKHHMVNLLPKKRRQTDRPSELVINYSRNRLKTDELKIEKDMQQAVKEVWDD